MPVCGFWFQVFVLFLSQLETLETKWSQEQYETLKRDWTWTKAIENWSKCNSSKGTKTKENILFALLNAATQMETSWQVGG